MTLLPDWAPNLHPLVVHFPIALLIVAALADLCALVLPRASWAESTARVLYPAGAVSALAAYLSGRQAAETVLMPGMAHAILDAHWNWALATTWFFGLYAVVRSGLGLRAGRPSVRVRAALTLAAVLGMLLLFGTAHRGGRLVYELGVGVAAPR